MRKERVHGGERHFLLSQCNINQLAPLLLLVRKLKPVEVTLQVTGVNHAARISPPMSFLLLIFLTPFLPVKGSVTRSVGEGTKRLQGARTFQLDFIKF